MKKKPLKDARRYALLALLGMAVVVLAIVFFRGGGTEQIKVKPAAPATAPGRPAAAGGAPAADTRVATLFLSSDDDGQLHREERKITASASVVDEASQVVRELIRGSNKGLLSPLPPATKLHRIFVTKEGIAYVDFSKEIADNLSGMDEEMAAVYSVVNTLAFNFKSIKKVFILVDGAEKETLGGHINLGEAFSPQFSLDAE